MKRIERIKIYSMNENIFYGYPRIVNDSEKVISDYNPPSEGKFKFLGIYKNPTTEEFNKVQSILGKSHHERNLIRDLVELGKKNFNHLLLLCFHKKNNLKF